MGISPFLRAGVEATLVEAAFADVAALVSLGLLQEVAASRQGAGLASALYHAVLQRGGQQGAALIALFILEWPAQGPSCAHCKRVRKR